MEKWITITHQYLYLPVRPGSPLKLLSFWDEKGSKIYEYRVPMDSNVTGGYQPAFYGEMPVADRMGQKIRITGEMTEAFMQAICVSGKKQQTPARKPAIHFSADTGWTNDPNGFCYRDGVYHLYFQYNPFNTMWENMTWGHAVSTDLIHWEQKDSVIFPDEDGTAYSGSALVNEQGLLGLPEDAIIYFYTAAGGVSQWSKDKLFTQRMGYSLDGGETVTVVREPVVPVISVDSRDPKVYWHEESRGYYMVLWLEDSKFGVLRSTDLKHWELTSSFELPGEWECPDMLHLDAEDGSRQWFFWTADGEYFHGSFDGYTFTPDGSCGRAYLGDTPYAAQTLWGHPEGKTITIPWLRHFMERKRNSASVYGFPTELTCGQRNGRWRILQKPAEILWDRAEAVEFDGKLEAEGKAVIAQCDLSGAGDNRITMKVNGIGLVYDPANQLLIVGRKHYILPERLKDVTFLLDDRQLELYANGGLYYDGYILHEDRVSLEMNAEEWGLSAVYTAL